MEDRTLASYDSRLSQYAAGTPSRVSGDLLAWLQLVIKRTPAHETLFEIGSGLGRDYLYLTEAGLSVIASDAGTGFLEYLWNAGIPAVKFNMRTDSFPRSYGFLANAVFLHLTQDEFEATLLALRDVITPGGFIAFSLKRGKGEEWSEEKLGAPRYFRYWLKDELVATLNRIGFSIEELAVTELWLQVIASPKETNSHG